MGLSRAGYSGALAAWVGFTLPSAIALIFFALGVVSFGDAVSSGALHGLKVVAAAVVAQAVWGMARTLCPDAQRVTLMALAACLVLMVPSAWVQVGVIVGAGCVGLAIFKLPPAIKHDPLPIVLSRRSGAIRLALFLVLLVGLPVLTQLVPGRAVALVDAFYSAGSSVLGGAVMLCCRFRKPRSCRRAGSASKHFSPAMVPPRRCPARCWLVVIVCGVAGWFSIDNEFVWRDNFDQTSDIRRLIGVRNCYDIGRQFQQCWRFHDRTEHLRILLADF